MTISLKKIIAYFIALLVLFGIVGCAHYDVVEVLLNRNDISLTIKGNPVFVFNPDNCQIAYNSAKNEYRAMTDSASEYFVLQAYQSLSSLGQEISADLCYTMDGRAINKKGLIFRIEKISNSEGLVWLWCSSDNIGLVIRVF